jgi:hypothetical protein
MLEYGSSVRILVNVYMSDYNKTIQSHKEDLELTRKIIVSLIVKLENIVNDNTYNKENFDEWKYLWGEKESVVSVLTKLTSLLVKVVPVERKLLDCDKTEKSNQTSGRIINSDDKEIIKRYIKKLNKSG